MAEFQLTVKGSQKDDAGAAPPADQQPQSAAAQAQNAAALPPGQEPPKEQTVDGIVRKFVADLRAAGHTVESAQLDGQNVADDATSPDQKKPEDQPPA